MVYFEDLAEGLGPGKLAAVRAMQAWQILVSLARNRQTMRYAQLGNVLYPDLDRATLALGGILGHIMRYCEENDLPPLTVLIVDLHGRPGEGLTTVPPEKRDELREDVYNTDWFSIVPPTVDDYLALK